MRLIQTALLVFLLIFSSGLFAAEPDQSIWDIRVQCTGLNYWDAVFQGTYTSLSVILDSVNQKSIDGFNFLIGYDTAALTYIDGQLGERLECWDYLSCQPQSPDSCDADCPTGLLRLVGLRDVSYGPPQPFGCDGEDGLFTRPRTELVSLIFLVSSAREIECGFVPVYFYWLDCEDNTIISNGGDTAYISNRVYDWKVVNHKGYTYELIPPDKSIDTDDHKYGAFDICAEGHIRAVNFYNGGLQLLCDCIPAYPGDLNLNHICNEIADALLFLEYLIYGSTAFTIDTIVQIAQTDVNRDNVNSSVADFVYLTRILTGDAKPFTRIYHLEDTVTISQKNNMISTHTDTTIGAILMVFDGIINLHLMVDSMDMKYDHVNGETRVLVYKIGRKCIPEGSNDIIRFEYEAKLIHFEAAGYYGSRLAAKIEASK